MESRQCKDDQSRIFDANSNPGRIPGKELKILIFTSNEVLSCGLDAVLRTLPIVESVTQPSEIGEAASLLGSDKFDIALITVHDAMKMSAFLHAPVAGNMKLLILIDDLYAKNPVIFDHLKVDGFIMEQDLSKTSLSDALRRTVDGDMPMPASLAAELLNRSSQRRPAERGSITALTDRENATLSLLAEGLSNKEIARILKVSSHGSKRLVAKVLLKLGASNRTEAVVTAIRQGLINPA